MESNTILTVMMEDIMVSKYQPVRKYRGRKSMSKKNIKARAKYSEKVINKQKENDRYNLGNWKDWS